MLILSLFPGMDLLGRAFERQGHCVVRSPDLLLGQDLFDWPLPPGGVFDGVIGGPPCQPFSPVNRGKSSHKDGVGLFWQIVEHVKPKFAVMENVTQVIGHEDIPDDAVPVVLRDWDCGGLTHRKRVFYTYPFEIGSAIMQPPGRDGNPEYSVLASSYKSRKERGHSLLKLEDAARLQGYSELIPVFEKESGGWRLYGKRFVCHMLGNGVPRAMGDFIAKSVTEVVQ